MSESRRTGAYTEQTSADKFAGEISALFEPFLIAGMSDEVWMLLQERLYRLILRIMREEKNQENA